MTTKSAPKEKVAIEKAKSENQVVAQPEFEPEALEASIKSASETAPSMIPPSEVADEGIEAGITAWQNNKKIGLLWSSQHARNGWAHVTGDTWHRINDANDSSHLSMVMMTAHAEQTQSTVNVKVETNGKISEIYVW